MLRTGEYTLMVFTDDVVSAKPADFEKLRGDATMRRLFLLTTIFRGRFTPEQLRGNVNATNLADQEMRSGVNSSKQIYLGGLELTLPPLEARDGLIYILDL